MFKAQIKVLDNAALQGVCSCTWRGNAIAQTAGVSKAIEAAQGEIDSHIHIPKPPKAPRKKKS